MPGVNPSAPTVKDTQLVWAAAVNTPVGTYPTTPSTDRYYLGRADEAGLVLRVVRGVVSTTVPLSALNYYTFRPFVTTSEDTTATVRYLGTGRATNTYKMNADISLRIHDEEYLNQALVKGTLVGVEITTTSAALGSPPSVKVTFQASLVRHGG
jgi:hypothetical protein